MTVNNGENRERGKDIKSEKRGRQPRPARSLVFLACLSDSAARRQDLGFVRPWKLRHNKPIPKKCQGQLDGGEECGGAGSQLPQPDRGSTPQPGKSGSSVNTVRARTVTWPRLCTTSRLHIGDGPRLAGGTMSIPISYSRYPRFICHLSFANNLRRPGETSLLCFPSSRRPARLPTQIPWP
jgi:hypothetical protein